MSGFWSGYVFPFGFSGTYPTSSLLSGMNRDLLEMILDDKAKSQAESQASGRRRTFSQGSYKKYSRTHSKNASQEGSPLNLRRKTLIKQKQSREEEEDTTTSVQKSHSELKFQKKSTFKSTKSTFLTFSKVQKHIFFSISKMAKNPFLHQNAIFGLKKRHDFWTKIILFFTFQIIVRLLLNFHHHLDQ